MALAALAAAWLLAAARLWRTRVPDHLQLPQLSPRRFFSAAEIARADRYETFLDVDALLASLAQVAVLIWYAARGERFARESAAGRIGTGILLGMLGFAFVWFAQLPFGLAGHWWQRRHGISHQGYLPWLLGDWLAVGGTFLFIALALAIVMGLAGVLRERWWILGGPALVAVGVAFAFAQPYLVPELRPLRDPQLSAEARSLARRLDVPGTGVRVQRVHQLTSAPNAEAAGIGPSQRVILWDTLLSRFPRRQVRIVIAHELAHLARRHLVKSLAWFALLAIPVGLAVQLVTRGRGGLHEPGAVPLAVLALVCLLLALTPLQNAFSRRLEAEADWIALETTRDPAAARRLFERFSAVALVRPQPPRWSQALRGNHPSLLERIAMTMAWSERARRAASAPAVRPARRSAIPARSGWPRANRPPPKPCAKGASPSSGPRALEHPKHREAAACRL